LNKIFHSILAVKELPTEWQETKVVFIPKAGKATHTTAKDFKPISLTSFLLKSFKRMISLQIRATFEPTQISEAQHAYTKGKSTESALHLVVRSIEKSLSMKEYTLIAFLDIEGAFNNLLPIATTESLTELVHKLGSGIRIAIVFNGKYPQTLCDKSLKNGTCSIYK